MFIILPMSEIYEYNLHPHPSIKSNNEFHEILFLGSLYEAFA